MKRAIRQLLLLAAVMAVLPASAATASGWDVLRDCGDDGAIQGSYSDSELNAALGNIEGDIAAYGDCAALINAAMGSGGRGGPKGKAARADENLTPAEKRAKAKRKAKEERKRKQIASIEDGIASDDGSGGLLDPDETSSNGMSLPMVLTLIALLCLLIGGGTWYAARRNPAIANALRRVPLPGRRS